jgi:hypothetical protein
VHNELALTAENALLADIGKRTNNRVDDYRSVNHMLPGELHGNHRIGHGAGYQA